MSEDHRMRFKNTGKVEEMRRRRAESSIELRKKKKEEQLMKRRNIESYDKISSSDEIVDLEPEEDGEVKQMLSNCMRVFQNNVTSEIPECVKSVRQLLSKQKVPPVDEVVASGVVPYLIGCLKISIPNVQFEAAWALTNILSGISEHTMAVVSFGGVQPLIDLLSSDDEKVVEQCTWAVSNIAGESAKLRDMVINMGVIPPLLKLLDRKHSSDEFLPTLAWTFSNLCRGKNPPPSIQTIMQLVPALLRLIGNENEAVAIDACWAFSYISDAAEDRIDIVLKSGVLPYLVKMLHSADMKIVSPALRTVGNIVTGDDQQTQMVVDTNILVTAVPRLLRSGKKTVTKECCWFISNITAGTAQQIQAVVEAGILGTVIELLKHADYQTQFEATWIINNIVSGGNDQQVNALLALDVLPALCQLLKINEAKTLNIVLDCLYTMFEVGARIDKHEMMAMTVEECGGLDVIESLQNHPSLEIYNKAAKLIAKFFSDHDESALDSTTESSAPAEDGYSFS